MYSIHSILWCLGVINKSTIIDTVATVTALMVLSPAQISHLLRSFKQVINSIYEEDLNFSHQQGFMQADNGTNSVICWYAHGPPTHILLQSIHIFLYFPYFSVMMVCFSKIMQPSIVCM